MTLINKFWTKPLRIWAHLRIFQIKVLKAIVTKKFKAKTLDLIAYFQFFSKILERTLYKRRTKALYTHVLLSPYLYWYHRPGIPFSTLSELLQWVIKWSVLGPILFKNYLNNLFFPLYCNICYFWMMQPLIHFCNIFYPVDTGRKLNIHKTFRRRPGRLLNVLCTFNLRPVSTGYPLLIL